MKVDVCKRCGSLFESVIDSGICPNCVRKLETTFKAVRHYIRSHPNASVYEVSEACNVDLELIRHWIKEERIEYTKDSVMGIECERCGKTIKTGRFCDACKTETIKNLKSVYVQNPKTDSKGNNSSSKDVRMRYLNKDNIKNR